MRITLFAVLAGLNTIAFAAATPTPDYWQCANRIGGSWNFGQVPSACDVDAFGDPAYVKHTFEPVLYQDAQSSTTERPRYVREMYTVLRDAAAYYLKMRKPTATSSEQAAWQRAIYAVAAQETWWTHYRNASDSRVKMVRGDLGHGHGMMQIDDRWHFTEIQQGKGWQLAQNVTYAFELYFAAWERAATATCVSGATDWRNRARSAYSQYNGGATKLCRFTNSTDSWAQNDINYAAKYDQQPWMPHISDLNQPSKVNVSCLMEGKEVCPPIGWTPSTWANRLLQLPTGDVCVLKNNALTCVSNLRDNACLTALTGIVPQSQELVAMSSSAGYSVNTIDRHQCPAAITGTRPVSRAVLLYKSINLRATPGGALLTTVPQNSMVQVLDWEVRTASIYDRYYKVRYQGQDGWLYAGNSSDYASWVVEGSYASLNPRFIVQAGYRAKVVISGGINVRSVPATGTILTVVPANTLLTVNAVKVLGETNAVYYQVSYNGNTGWIYGGQAIPGSTLASWVIPG